MSQSASSVVQLAIALTTLKHKPREQSIAAYLLDLQACFPLQESNDRGAVGPCLADNDPGLARRETSAEWRTYALELEKQLATLKAQRDTDEELLARLRVRPDESQSDAAPPKKRRKKNQSTSKDRQEYEWNWNQSRDDWTNVLHSQRPPPPSLVQAYMSLKGCLASPNDDHVAFAARLSDAILRALETMHSFMFSPSGPAEQQRSEHPIPSIQLRPEYIDSTRIAMVSPLLMYILRVALPDLVRTTQDTTKSKRLRPSQRPETTTHVCIDKVIDRLLECVLLPLLRALTPLCVARLAGLLPPPPPLSKKATRRRDSGEKRSEKMRQADVRTDIFAFLGMSLTALNGLASQPQSHSGPGNTKDKDIMLGIRDRLGLEAIREIEALYGDTRPSGPSSPKPAPTQAVTESQSNTSTTETGMTATVTEAERRAKALEKLIGTRAERVYALARRDATWFLASTLNLCVGQALPDGKCSGLLKEALIGKIGKLVRDVGAGERTGPHELGVDPVCKGMLLATCERAASEFT